MYIACSLALLMDELDNYLPSDTICPITGLPIVPVLPKDALYGLSYVIPDINRNCLIRISTGVLIDPEIMGVLRRFKKQFGINLLMNKTVEIVITTENYLAFVAQLSAN